MSFLIQPSAFYLASKLFSQPAAFFGARFFYPAVFLCYPAAYSLFTIQQPYFHHPAIFCQLNRVFPPPSSFLKLIGFLPFWPPGFLPLSPRGREERFWPTAFYSPQLFFEQPFPPSASVVLCPQVGFFPRHHFLFGPETLASPLRKALPQHIAHVEGEVAILSQPGLASLWRHPRKFRHFFKLF